MFKLLENKSVNILMLTAMRVCLTVIAVFLYMLLLKKQIYLCLVFVLWM